MKSCFFCLITVLLFGLSGFAQGKIDDNELWTGIEIKQGVGERFGWSVVFDWRQRDNFETFARALLQFDLEYELPIESLEWHVGYRYAFHPAAENNKQRLYTDLSYKKRFKPFNISNRLRYQLGRENYDLWREGQSELREKIKLEYQRKKKHKLTPFVAVEFFWELDEPQWDAYRLQAGLGYEINKQQSIGLTYFYAHKGLMDRPFRQNVFEVDYTYKLKRIKRKERIEKGKS